MYRYKQATVGPNNTEKPSMFKPHAKYKWTAWKNCSSLSKQEAKRAYVDIIQTQQPREEIESTKEEDPLDAEFELAAEYIKRNNDGDESSKLKLYGLYKQATVGPNNKPEPSAMNPISLHKWKSWKAYSKLSKSEAKRAYVDLVQMLQEDAALQHHKAITIQRHYRGYRMRHSSSPSPSTPLQHQNAITIQRHYRGYRFRSNNHHLLEHGDHRYDLCRILLITDLSEECDDEVAFEVLVRGLTNIKDCSFVIELLVPDARERLQWFATVFEEHFQNGDWRWYVVF